MKVAMNDVSTRNYRVTEQILDVYINHAHYINYAN